MIAHGSHPHGSVNPRKEDLNKRLEDVGWALFFILIGALFLVPAGRVPQSTWLIGTGLILLGVNAVRYLSGITMSAFTIALGVLALAAGLGDAFGVKLPLFASFLILLGVGMILKPWLKWR